MLSNQRKKITMFPRYPQAPTAGPLALRERRRHLLRRTVRSLRILGRNPPSLGPRFRKHREFFIYKDFKILMIDLKV